MAWSAGGNVSTGRRHPGGAGTPTAAIMFGGYTTVNLDSTEEYDGSSWSAGGNLSIAKRSLRGCGTLTAGLAVGGFTTADVATTEEYDGTSWSSGGALSTALSNCTAFGVQTDAVSVGRGTDLVTEHYNGTSWSAGTAYPAGTGIQYLASFGTRTAGVICGGNAGGTYYNTTYTYDGSAWSASGNISATTAQHGASGTSTNGLRAGGTTNGTTTISTSETFNGSTWAANTALSTARRLGTSATNSSAGEGLIAAGYDGAANLASTEEWLGDLSKTVTDTATGSDALSLNGTITVSDTATGTDSISLPRPMLDTGTGTDAVSVTVYVVIAETPTVTDALSLVSKYLPIADTVTGTDSAIPHTGDLYTVTDTGSGTDAISITVSFAVSDTGAGADAITVSGNTAVLFLVVTGFPSNQTVEYRIEDGDGNLVQDWTSSGVQEYARGDGKSRYRVWHAKITNGIVDWRIQSTTYYATESFNIYGSLSDGAGYTSTRASNLDYLDRANSASLADADYIAPDNAGIASTLAEAQSQPTLAEMLAGGVAKESTLATAQTDITTILNYAIAMSKWKNNKLRRTGISGTTETWVLYDDDSSSPLLTWTHDTANVVRTKAT